MSVELRVGDGTRLVGMAEGEASKGPKCTASFRQEVCGKTDSPHWCEPRVKRVKLAFASMRLWQPPYTGDPIVPVSWIEDLLDAFFGVVIWNKSFEQWVLRYEEPLICLPRRHAKSTITAAIINYFARSLPPGSDLAIAAQTKERTELGLAQHVYNIYLNSPDFWGDVTMEKNSSKRCFEISFPGQANVTHIYLASANQPDTLRGYNLAFFAADEYAFMPKASELIEGVVRSGAGNLANHIAFRISTPERNLASYERQLVKRATTLVAANPDEEPTWLPFIYQLEPWEDPGDQKVWRRVAPFLDAGIVDIGVYEREWSAAQFDPERMAKFMTERLCSPDDAVSGFVSNADWSLCTGTQADGTPHTRESVEEKLMSLPIVYAGCDLAHQHDFTALSIVGLDPEEDLLYITTYGWIPTSQVEKLNRLLSGKVAEWLREGTLKIMAEDKLSSHEILAGEMQEILSSYKNCFTVAIDPYESKLVSVRLQDAGYRVVEVNQNPATVHAGINSLRSAALKHAIAHGGHSLLTYSVQSAQVSINASNRCRMVAIQELDKDSRRIDNILAAVLAEKQRLEEGAVSAASPLFKVRTDANRKQKN